MVQDEMFDRNFGSADNIYKHLPAGLAKFQPYFELARLERPVGIWLLFLPCIIGLAQMRIATGFMWIDLFWIIAFFIGAVVMRGAGCVWNDITDRHIDAQVERTADRPLPSGRLSVEQAYVFFGLLLAIGFLVWLVLPATAKIIALLSLPLLATYPYMKRITWWPQAWLGFTFNWGALIGGAVAFDGITGANLLLFFGLVAWTIAYDTIYALQDVEDDAMAGVKSTARLFADKVLTGIFSFHLIATVFIAAGAALAGAGRFGAITALLFLVHGIWQLFSLQQDKYQAARAVFKSNVYAGAILAIGLSFAVIF